MRRETLVYSVAGIVFGLVVGYMAASFHVVPHPAASEAQAAAAPAPATPTAKKLNPDEVAALESLAARQTTDASVRVELGTLYMEAERWDEAIRWYREALALNPALPDARLDLGTCLERVGRPEEGLAEFDKVLQGDPSHRIALVNRVITLRELGRPAETVAALQELVKRYPDDPQVQSLRRTIELTSAPPPAGR